MSPVITKHQCCTETIEPVQKTPLHTEVRLCLQSKFSYVAQS